jgi:hypothetical protein
MLEDAFRSSPVLPALTERYQRLMRDRKRCWACGSDAVGLFGKCKKCKIKL